MKHAHLNSLFVWLGLVMLSAWIGLQALAENPQPNIVLTTHNYKQYAASGMHLYPGEIIEIGKFRFTETATVTQRMQDTALTWAGDGPKGQTFYRAGNPGSTGLITVERGHPELAYLWALGSLLDKPTEINVVVDQQRPYW